jgi:hypothetical protein
MGLLGLKRGILIPDYADYPQTVAASLAPTNPMVADMARAQGGLAGYVHPFSEVPDPEKDAVIKNELPVSAALGKIDYIEVVGFSDHRATAEVWYKLLNLGFRIPAGAGTDAMTNYASLRGPLGTNRVYVRVPGGGLKMETWLAGLKAGRTFATNGPLLDFTLEGKIPGDEIHLPAAGQLSFSASLRSIVPVEHLEVVCSGKVMQEIPLTGDRTSADAKATVKMDRSGWCVLRAWSSRATYPVLDIYPYATTSPIYVNVGDALPRSPADAAYFLKWLDRLEQFTRAHQGWNTPAERDAALAEITAARAIFEKRGP